MACREPDNLSRPRNLSLRSRSLGEIAVVRASVIDSLNRRPASGQRQSGMLIYHLPFFN